MTNLRTGRLYQHNARRGHPDDDMYSESVRVLASTWRRDGTERGSTQLSPNDGSGCPAISPIGPGAAIGNRFLLSGTPVPLTRRGDGQYVAFRPLSQLARIFPISERTSYSSLRCRRATLITNNNLAHVPCRIQPEHHKRYPGRVAEPDARARTIIRERHSEARGFLVRQLARYRLLEAAA